MGPNNQNVKSTKFRLKSSMSICENRSSAATYESKVMHPGREIFCSCILMDGFVEYRVDTRSSYPHHVFRRGAYWLEIHVPHRA